MTFEEFMDNLEDLKDEAIIENFRSVLKELAKVEDVEFIKNLVIDMSPEISYHEDNDGFGTEGMRL